MPITHESIPGYGATVDATITLAHYLEREWGAYGRRMSVLGLSDGSAVAACSHSDGSQWWIGTDRDGSNLFDADTFDDLRAKMNHAGGNGLVPIGSHERDELGRDS